MKKIAMILAGLGVLAPAPALADNVDFNGAVTASCALSAVSPGTLSLSADGQTLSSLETGGSSAGLHVSAIGTPPQVVFTVPSLTSAPVGFNATHTDEIAYTSTGGASQAFTANGSNFQMTGFADDFTVDGRSTLTGGNFLAGNYTLRTVATCEYN